MDEMLLEEINLRPEGKAFHSCAVAEPWAMGARQSFSPGCLCQQPTQSAEQKHGELIMRHLISFPVKGGRWYKAVCPPHQSLSALLERTPGCLETIQTPARVFITPRRAAAWVTWHPSSSSKGAKPADLRD